MYTVGLTFALKLTVVWIYFIFFKGIGLGLGLPSCFRYRIRYGIVVNVGNIPQIKTSHRSMCLSTEPWDCRQSSCFHAGFYASIPQLTSDRFEPPDYIALVAQHSCAECVHEQWFPVDLHMNMYLHVSVWTLSLIEYMNLKSHSPCMHITFRFHIVYCPSELWLLELPLKVSPVLQNVVCDSLCFLHSRIFAVTLYFNFKGTVWHCAMIKSGCLPPPTISI